MVLTPTVNTSHSYRFILSHMLMRPDVDTQGWRVFITRPLNLIFIRNLRTCLGGIDRSTRHFREKRIVLAQPDGCKPVTRLPRNMSLWRLWVSLGHRRRDGLKDTPGVLLFSQNLPCSAIILGHICPSGKFLLMF